MQIEKGKQKETLICNQFPTTRFMINFNELLITIRQHFIHFGSCFETGTIAQYKSTSSKFIQWKQSGLVI